MRRIDFQNCGDGIYESDSTAFTGVEGQKYTLHIHTSDGRDFISDECTMLRGTGIDSVYYEKGEEILGSMNYSYTGLKIKLNTAHAGDTTGYFRWTYDENWKFNVPYPPSYTFKQVNDTLFYFDALPTQNTTCSKNSKSSQILISSANINGDNTVTGQEIKFIAPVLSDRLTLMYTIEIKQYSISEKEYTFWKQLKEVGEPTSDIFGSQPYPIKSNIHNANNPDEKALGYFEVSAVSKKKIVITPGDAQLLDLPYYKTDCEYIRRCPDDWPPPPDRPTWAGIYDAFVNISHFIFVTPEVSDGVVLPGYVNIKDLKKLVFTSPVCAYCK